jgi:NADH-quinone oxidoreductase subunit I
VIALLAENCTSCMLCARECPDWCIYIDAHKETIPAATPGGRDRQRNVLDRFAIDYSLCMYCGICVEVCPFDALFWSPQFEYAELDIRDLLHEKDRLGGWMDSVPAPAALDSGAADPAEVTAQRAPARPARVIRRPPAGGARVTSLDLAFAGAGVVTLAAALLAVTTRHLVHSALWLVLSLGGLAGCYLVLGAELVALVQVPRLCRGRGGAGDLRADAHPRADRAEPRAHHLAPAPCVGRIAGAAASPPCCWRCSSHWPGARQSRAPPVDSAAIAGDLFATWVWPFEALSLLLLLALIGAFSVARLAGGRAQGAP